MQHVEHDGLGDADAYRLAFASAENEPEHVLCRQRDGDRDKDRGRGRGKGWGRRRGRDQGSDLAAALPSEAKRGVPVGCKQKVVSPLWVKGGGAKGLDVVLVSLQRSRAPQPFLAGAARLNITRNADGIPHMEVGTGMARANQGCPPQAPWMHWMHFDCR